MSANPTAPAAQEERPPRTDVACDRCGRIGQPVRASHADGCNWWHCVDADHCAFESRPDVAELRSHILYCENECGARRALEYRIAALGGCGDREGVGAEQRPTGQSLHLLAQEFEEGRWVLSDPAEDRRWSGTTDAQGWAEELRTVANAMEALHLGASSLRTPEPMPSTFDWIGFRAKLVELRDALASLSISHPHFGGYLVRANVLLAMLDEPAASLRSGGPLFPANVGPATTPSTLRGTEAESTRELCARCVGEGCDRCDGSGYEAPASSTPAERPPMSDQAEEYLRYLAAHPIQGWLGEFAREIVRLRGVSPA